MRNYDDDLKLLKAWHSMCSYCIEKTVQHPWVSPTLPPGIVFGLKYVNMENSMNDSAMVSGMPALVIRFLECIWDDAVSDIGSTLYPKLPAVDPALPWRKQFDYMFEQGDKLVEAYARTL